MKNAKSIIGIVIAIILIVLLGNPQWLPFSAQTAESMKDLRTEHFLIEGSGEVTIARILTLILALAIVWLAYTIIKLILTAAGKKNDHAATVTTLVAGVLKYIAVLAALVWGLSILGVNATAVLAGIGIIGLILGFGAQSLIEDIVTGLFVIFERQYEIGDIIVLDDFRGTVRSIGVRTTTIEDPGGNLKVVNNSNIRNFQNRSKNNSFAICEVSVAYDTDIPRMESILEAAFPKMYADHADVYLAEPRYLGLDSLADSGMVLKIGVNCLEKDVFGCKRKLNRDVRILFFENNIEIPFPQVVVHKG